MKTSKKLDEEASPINIPQAKRTWPLEQIPLSARLERVLRELGCQKLGDLDGLTFHQVAGVRSCGVATLRELRKLLESINSPEFDLSAEVEPENLRSLIRGIDSFLQSLPPAKLQMLLVRFGGTSAEEGNTLEEIGHRFKLSREGIRQIINSILGQLYRECGPQGLLLLSNIGKKCLDSVQPLAPQLLGSWLGPQTSHQHPLPFYIRLLKELDPTIPAWPNGQHFDSELQKRHTEIVRQVEKLLIQKSSPMALDEIFKQLKIGGPHPEVTVQEFLDLLQQCPDLPVELLAASSHPRASKRSKNNRLKESGVTSIIRPEAIAVTDLAYLVSLIDDCMDRLSLGDRERLLKQLGGREFLTEGQPSRLDSVSDRNSRSIDGVIAQVQKLGGPALASFSREITQRCHRLVCPLTPRVLESWCDARFLDSQYPWTFYIRLLASLEPQLPAWPDGQRGSGVVSKLAATVIGQVERISKESKGTLQLKDMFHQLKSHSGLSGLTVKEFLDALQQHPSLSIDFILPLRVRRQRKGPTNLSRQ
jgi:Sigma-70, region 4